MNDNADLKPDPAKAEARKQAQAIIDMLKEKCGPLEHIPAWAQPEALFTSLTTHFYDTERFAREEKRS